jgi:hypothetical protein
MKAVDILVDADRAQDLTEIELRRQRQLDENAVRVILIVQFKNLVDQGAWISVARETNGRRLDSDLITGPSLVANTDLGRGIVPNHDYGELGCQPVVRFEPLNAPAALSPGEARYSPSIDNLRNQTGLQREGGDTYGVLVASSASRSADTISISLFPIKK